MPKRPATKIKIPKRIGGYKVPKKLRKAGKKIVAGAANPLMLELAALGLGMASAAASKAAKARLSDPASWPAMKPHARSANRREVFTKAPPAASNDPHEIGVALGKMAEAALAGLFKPKR